MKAKLIKETGVLRSFNTDKGSKAEEILKNCKHYWIETLPGNQETVILLDDAIEAINKYLNH